MITTLRAGMKVRLPSGNLIVLRSRERATWTCEYVAGRYRGEVEFSTQYLRRFGVTFC